MITTEFTHSVGLVNFLDNNSSFKIVRQDINSAGFLEHPRHFSYRLLDKFNRFVNFKS